MTKNTKMPSKFEDLDFFTKQNVQTCASRVTVVGPYRLKPTFEPSQNIMLGYLRISFVLMRKFSAVFITLIAPSSENVRP